MSKNTSARRAATLKSRATEVIASVSKTPDPTTDFITSFKTNSAARTDQSNEFTVDLFPDSVLTTCYIMSMCQKYASDFEKTKHAKASFPSLVYYCVSLYHGYYLLNDMYIRTTPSEYADIWLQNHNRLQFTETLLALPVPTFMEPILTQLSATESERRPNIHFVPTYAGYTHDTHHGKFIPPAFFINIHNTICDLTATSKLDTLDNLLRRPVFKITNIATAPAQAQLYQATLIDYLGGTFTNTAPSGQTPGSTQANFLDSKWFQYYDMLFNPVLSRTYQRREHLAEITFHAPTFPTPSKINIYDLLFPVSKQNITEQAIVLQAIAGLIKGIVPFTNDLCTVISNASGNAILEHGYSLPPLPVTTHDTTDLSYKLVKVVKDTATTHAAGCNFLVIPAKATTSNTIGKPTVLLKSDDSPASATHKIGNLFSSAFYRVHEADSTSDYPADADFMTFDEDTHYYPKVYVLDVTASAGVSSYLATLTGKVIETADIDGTTIGVPNTKTPLGQENSLFSDSAIPYSMVASRRLYDRNTATTGALVALKRAKTDRQSRHPASSLLVDRTKVILPKYEPTQNEQTGQNFFSGLTSQNNVTWLTYALRFIGFKTADQNSNAYDSIPGTDGARKLVLWSPYSITTAQDEDSYDTPDPALTRRYFLTNLRTLVGTDIPLVEVKSGFEALPV